MNKNTMIILVAIFLALLILVAGSFGLWFFKFRKVAAPTSKPSEAAAAAASGAGSTAATPPKVSKAQGEFGKPASFEQFNLIVNRVEYSVGRVVASKGCLLPGAGEKYLLLRYTIESKWTTPITYNWGTLSFAARDPGQTEHEYNQHVMAQATGVEEGVEIQPGGKVDFVAMIPMPAEAKAVTLVARSGPENVVEYPLQSKVPALVAPYADPSDPSGCRPANPVTATMGTYYPVQEKIDVLLESVSLAAKSITGEEPPEKQCFLIAVWALQNKSKQTTSFNWGVFTPTLVDEGGNKSDWNNVIYKADANEEISELEAEPETARKIRHCIPVSVSAKSLKLTIEVNENTRAFKYLLNDLKPPPAASAPPPANP